MSAGYKSPQARAAKIAQRFWQQEADAMHAALVKHVDSLVGCTEGSPEEKEHERITDVIEAYEIKKTPSS